jgi:hypothetical protein
MIEYVLILIALVVVVGIAVVSSEEYSVVEWIIFAFFLTVIVIVGSQYFFGVNITTSIKQMLENPKIDINVVNTDGSSDGAPATKKEVFHVPGQYDYVNSKALCRAYGGTLANIQQITDAYKAGADWCDYGWSDDQMALYPTQTKTWQAFKETEIHKQDCGRPGVNGGYFNNAKQKLGANCYGPKPAQIGELKPLVIPKSPEEAAWKEPLPEAAPFNYQKWEQ